MLGLYWPSRRRTVFSFSMRGNYDAFLGLWGDWCSRFRLMLIGDDGRRVPARRFTSLTRLYHYFLDTLLLLAASRHAIYRRAQLPTFLSSFIGHFASSIAISPAYPARRACRRVRHFDYISPVREVAQLLTCVMILLIFVMSFLMLSMISNSFRFAIFLFIIFPFHAAHSTPRRYRFTLLPFSPTLRFFSPSIPRTASTRSRRADNADDAFDIGWGKFLDYETLIFIRIIAIRRAHCR